MTYLEDAYMKEGYKALLRNRECCESYTLHIRWMQWRQSEIRAAWRAWLTNNKEMCL